MWRSSSALFFVALSAIGCAKKGEPASAEEAIGVVECDDFIKKMDAFLADLPEEARTAREPGFKAMRASWREAAQTPAGKEGLKAACKAQLATLPAAK